MRALVLAGGLGTRLRPISYSMPKQLIPIANTPILEHVLGNIRTMGVTEVGIIVGDWAGEIESVLGDGSRFGMRIEYIFQSQPLGLAHCVQLARPFLGEDDFVMYLGDNFLTGDLRGIADEFRRDRPAAQVLVQKVSDPSSYGIVELTVDGAVRRLHEKPRQPVGDLAIMGVYLFTPAIHEAVGAIAPSARGELEITDAIQWLLTEGRRVNVTRFEGFWRDTGQPRDVLECNSRLLGALRGRIAGEVDESSRISGPVVIGAGSRVVRSRIEGPVVIGAGCLIEDSHIGPDVAIGDGCLVRSTKLADSIVMDRASVSELPGVRGSIIGRGAVVGRGEGDGYHSLLVGDHVRIEFVA